MQDSLAGVMEIHTGKYSLTLLRLCIAHSSWASANPQPQTIAGTTAPLASNYTDYAQSSQLRPRLPNRSQLFNDSAISALPTLQRLCHTCIANLSMTLSYLHRQLSLLLPKMPTQAVLLE